MRLTQPNWVIYLSKQILMCRSFSFGHFKCACRPRGTLVQNKSGAWRGRGVPYFLSFGRQKPYKLTLSPVFTNRTQPQSAVLPNSRSKIGVLPCLWRWPQNHPSFHGDHQRSKASDSSATTWARLGSPIKSLLSAGS